jgi:hypothetical protein
MVGVMDNRPRDKKKDSSWNDQNDRITNPNRRQEEEADDVETPRDQRASRNDPGSSESTPRGDERLHRDQGSARRLPDE